MYERRVTVYHSGERFSDRLCKAGSKLFRAKILKQVHLRIGSIHENSSCFWPPSPTDRRLAGRWSQWQWSVGQHVEKDAPGQLVRGQNPRHCTSERQTVVIPINYYYNETCDHCSLFPTRIHCSNHPCLYSYRKND